MQTRSKDFWKLFKPSACSLKLKASTQDGVFEEITSLLVKSKQLDPSLAEEAVTAFKERELLASTGVGSGVAIPHTKLAGLETPIFSLCLAPEGLEWNSVDGEKAQIFFGVLRPDRPSETFDPDRHLDMMRWISSLARVADFRRFALAVSTRKELVDLLKEMSNA
ncbi:MAG TPA: PTS sugar transporter subunit IIA [Planctomycetes bacterium]|nr:PTS sugar transporter subunit IIA [Planctomycetota bacterium]